VTGNDPPQFPGFIKIFREMKAAFAREADPREKRRLWQMQLLAIIAIVDKFDQDVEGLSGPLRDLHLALQALEFGAIEPELKPRKTVGRPQELRAAVFRGHAAAAAALLIRGGFSAGLADRLVAGRLDGSGYQRPSGGSIIEATIRGWRKEAREGDRGDPTRLAYDHFLEPHLLDALIDHPPPFEPSVPPEMRRGFIESILVLNILHSTFPSPGGRSGRKITGPEK